MTAISKLRLGLAACCLLAASGCANKEEPAAAAKAADVPLSCIAVLPVLPAADLEDAASPADHKALAEGSQVMNGLLKEVLAGQTKVRFVAEDQTAVSGAGLSQARQRVGKSGCNAALEISLSRYAERVGGDYGVKRPAAVTFAYKLYETGEGRVLCHGRFDEQQQTVMENLLTLPKVKNRGLTWLTAEELAREGLQERLGQCSYLGGK